MKQKRKHIVKSILSFVLTFSMVLGLVPIDGLMNVAYATDMTYTITIADGINNGTVTADKTTAVEGETVTLTISPDNLYELYDLSVKCGESTVPFYWGTKSFVMPAGNVTVNAAFKKKTTYTTDFKYSDKMFSKTTPTGETSTFALTEVLTGLQIATGTISNVEINGSCVTASQQDNQWLLTTHYGGDSFAPTATLNVTVNGTGYTINVSASQDSIPVVVQGSVRFDSNGGSGTMEAMNGRSDMFFVLPECSFTAPDGMEFDIWKIGSDYYPAGTTYRWKESVVAYAQWKDIEGVHSTIVSNSEPSKGSLVVSPTKALQNTNIVLTPQPANGYAVDSISYSYEGSGTLQPTANQDGTYSFSMPDKDVTVTITFKEDTAVSIPYLDANGNNANCTSNTYVSESDTTWNTGWYVVNRTLTINNRIVVDGNVNLILADGATLNAQSGITVYGNNSLNIFAQSTGENKGKLCADATQKPNYAAIGGANSEETMNCGTVNIYGGYIEAHGGQNSAGIGGGDVSAYKGGSGGTITINAGTIKSYGGNWYGAGIGGGRRGNGGIIRINGGYVEAYGNYGAAGIGGGLDGESGIITIAGGTILAKGSICEGYKPEWGAGIGSGRDAETNKIEITGGNVTAYGASDSAAIGSGRNKKCNEIIISGGVVNAIAYSTNDVGIGSSRSSTSTGTISLSWTNVSTDEINSSSYKGTVTLKKAFVDKLDSTVSFEAGDLSDNSAIGGKTIVPHDSSAHYHRFTYVVSQDGKTITATCGNSGCSLTNNAATLTIAAPTGSLVYDGSAKAATVTGDTSVLGTPSIAYKKGNTSLGLNAPKDVGTYTASITLGSGEGAVTVSVGFTITARPITITAADQSVELNGEIATGTDMWSVNGELADGQSISKVTLTASSTASAGSGTITPSAVIKDASGVIVTANYNITYTAGTLTVTDASVHTHSFTYSASGATITATCGVNGCPLTNSQATLTIEAPTGDLTYDGTAKAATLTGGIPGVTTPSIVYKQGDTALASAPINAGSYTASITVGGETASISYTIEPKSITIPKATSGLKWTGDEQTGVADASGYNVTDGKATAVGNYTATVALKDKTNTKWSDDSTVDQSIAWSIGKADGPAAPTGLTATAPTTDGGSDGKISGVNSTMEYSDNSGFTSKTDCAGTEITGLSAGTYYVRVKETETHEAGGYATVKVPAYVAPTYEVTYKVVNGTWSDDSTTNKTETVQSGSKPASVPTGMKAGSGYTGGAWDTDPADATITGATTFTYTFSAIPTYTVTYKVVGGTWSDDSTTNKTETVQSGSKPASVPTGMKAGSGYTGGAWDTDPADATITGATTFTYSFTAKQAAIVKKAPTAKTLTYTGSAQELVTAGEATGGTMYYAATTENTAPADNLYTTSISAKTDAGTYYVWYKVKGDTNYNDTKAESVKVSIAKATPTYTKPDDKEITCNQTLKNIELGVGFSFVNPNQELDFGENTVNVKYTPTDTANYNILDNISIKVTIRHAFEKEAVADQYLKSVADCTHKAVYYKSCECGEKGTETFEYGETLDHNYGKPTYTWSDDYKTCTAVKTCSRCNDSITETVNATSITTQATCEGEGKTTYTATFTKNGFEKQTKEVIIVPTGHDYEELTYTWSEDGKKCSATAVCANDATHVITENATVTSKVTTPSTCKDMGKTTYTAAFTNKNFTTQTKEVTDVAKLTTHTPKAAVKEKEVVATCEKAGSYEEVVYCSVCNKELSRETKTVDKLGHKMGDWVVTTPATETTKGVETRTCTRKDCNYSETRDIPMLSHEHTYEKVEAKDASCSKEGNIEYWTCKGCGKLFADKDGKNEINVEDTVIEKAAHTPGKAVKEKEVAATCEEDGSYDEVVYCSVCKAEISRKKVTVHALGHSFGEWVKTKDPSETEPGLYTRTCKNDPSHTETKEIPVTTHKHKIVPVTEVPATCTNDGAKAHYICSECDLLFEDADGTKEILDESTLVIKGGHKGGKATCSHKAVCEVCHEEYGELDPDNHEGETEVRGKVDATCTADGFSGDVYCKACNKLIENGNVVKATGHDYGTPEYKWSDDGKTCTATVICKRAGCTDSVEGHKVTEDATITSKVKEAATTEKMGTTTYTATFKNELFTTQTKDVADIPKLDKPSDNPGDNPSGKPSDKPADKPQDTTKDNQTTQTETPTTPVVKEEGTTLSVAETKAEVVVTSKAGEEPTVEYKGTTDAAAKEVTVPDSVTVDGVTYKVTLIAKEAFKGNKTLEKATVGENIETVGDKAFAGCTKLKTVVIKESVKEIGNSAFEGCSKLSTITLGSNVETVGNKAFANCKSLTKIIIPKSTKKIGNYAFKGNKKLKTIIVKTTKLTKKTVAKRAFSGVGNKVTIKVPKSKKKVYKKLFRKRGLSKKVKVI